MSQSTIPSAPEIALADIHVKEDFNPRTTFDPVAIDELAAAIEVDGLLEPFLLHFDDSGTAWLIAGERRLIAAKQAGLEVGPYSVYAGDNPRRAALAENMVRVDLNPIEQARGLQALVEEGAKKDVLAKEMRKSRAWLGTRLRLLDLPEGVHDLIAEKVVPVEAEKTLREVAKVSPRIAECVCITAERKKVSRSEFLAEFPQLLLLTSAANFPDPPTMINTVHPQVSDLVGDPDKRKELTARLAALGAYPSEDPYVNMSSDALDSARAAGCLLEYHYKEEDWESTVSFITDAEFAADLTEVTVERREADARKRAEEEAAWREKAGGAEPTTPEQDKEARASARAEAKAKSISARVFNLNLGVELQKRRGKATRRQHGLARAQAIAAILLADNPELPGRGMPLAFSQLQEVEVKVLKSKEPREKVHYAEKEECLAFVERQIGEAKTADEVLEILADTLIAAEVADQDELPQSRRIGWWSHGREAAMKLLAPDTKAVKPRRSRKK